MTRPLPADFPSLPTLWLLRACSVPRGHSRPRTRHKCRPPRHKKRFSNVAPKSLFARRRLTPARAAAAARLLGAMGREPDPRHGRERQKASKTTLENSYFYKTSLKSGFFESTILSKLPKSRVVLGGQRRANGGRRKSCGVFLLRVKIARKRRGGKHSGGFRGPGTISSLPASFHILLRLFRRILRENALPGRFPKERGVFSSSRRVLPPGTSFPRFFRIPSPLRGRARLFMHGRRPAARGVRLRS